MHRDFKPANIMVQSAGADGATRRKGDREDHRFRYRQSAYSETPDARVQTHRDFIGTPAFASPEQFAGATVDVQSRYYSLGATLHYLLSGRLLRPDNTLVERKDSARSVAPQIHQLRAAHVPACLLALLTAMLADEPAARPSVGALATQLGRIHHQLADPRKQLRRILAVPATFLAVAGCAAALIFRPFASTPPSSHADVPRKTIAVLLEFENLSDDASKASIC